MAHIVVVVSYYGMQDINHELEAIGLDPLTEIDRCPERKYYKALIQNPNYEDKEYGKRLKAATTEYVQAFHNYFAKVYPYLMYELGEDKTYWLYDDEAGVYNEVNFSVVRNYVIELMVKEGLRASATEGNVKNVLNKYRAEYQERGCAYSDFDNNPFLFHANNGWVNVKTLEFTPHVPTLLSRRKSAVDYKSDATCPTYDNFIDTQVDLRADQVRVIDQFSGLLLTPDITQQKMLVLIGKPGCGKSTLLDLWSDVLGDCSTQKALHEISSDSFRFGGSDLVGKSLCWFDEVEVSRSEMGNSLINLITGQNIRVERKGINGIVNVQNQLKCVLTANTLPRSAEMGIYRRMILIYMNYSFTDNMTVDRMIRQKLIAESSGVLNRMLRGLRDLHEQGEFSRIEGHDDLIEEYKASSNTVAEFLDEYFVFDYDAPKVSTKVLLEAYKEFANDKYVSSLTPQRFGMLLGSHGLSQFSKIVATRGTGGSRMWSGLKLKDLYEYNSAGLIREKQVF